MDKPMSCMECIRYHKNQMPRVCVWEEHECWNHTTYITRKAQLNLLRNAHKETNV